MLKAIRSVWNERGSFAAAHGIRGPKAKKKLLLLKARIEDDVPPVPADACFKARIFVVYDVKPSAVTEPEGRFGFPKGEGVKGAAVPRGSDSNGDAAAVTWRVNGQDLGVQGAQRQGVCAPDRSAAEDWR